MEQHSTWNFETQYQLVLSKLKLGDLNQNVEILS